MMVFLCLAFLVVIFLIKNQTMMIVSLFLYKINFGVSFRLFKKGSVRGENANELFKFLTSKQRFMGFSGDKASMLSEYLKQNYPEFLAGDDVKWNFTKFVVDRNGDVMARFEPTDDVSKARECVKTLI